MTAEARAPRRLGCELCGGALPLSQPGNQAPRQADSLGHSGAALAVVSADGATTHFPVERSSRPRTRPSAK